jgi:hypothetical protein
MPSYVVDTVDVEANSDDEDCCVATHILILLRFRLEKRHILVYDILEYNNTSLIPNLLWIEYNL